MERYVIYLSSKQEFEQDRGNSYGYWQGKNSIKCKEILPYCTPRIGSDTKVYLSKKRAETALKKHLEDDAYVLSGRVETLM